MEEKTDFQKQYIKDRESPGLNRSVFFDLEAEHDQRAIIRVSMY